MPHRKYIQGYELSFTEIGKELNETPAHYLSHIIENKRNVTSIHSAKKETEEINLFQENDTELMLFLTSNVLQLWGKTKKSIHDEQKGIEKLTANIINFKKMPILSIK